MLYISLFVCCNLLLIFSLVSISPLQTYRNRQVNIFSSSSANLKDTTVLSSTTTTTTRVPIQLINLSSHHIPYLTAWEYQKRLLKYHIDQQTSNSHDIRSSSTTISSSTSLPCVGSLLVLQHSPVYTLGTATQTDAGPFHHLIEDETGHRTVNYDTVTVERAGQATYHGPGQIVLYPILDLHYFAKDIHFYLRSLEQIVINTCHDFNITHVGRVEGQTGVWIDDSIKIAAMGIKLRRWVTMHGVSVNVNPNLKHFANIIPCGIVDKSVGSLTQFSPDVTLDQVYERLLFHFSQVFNVKFAYALSDAEAVEYLSLLPATTSSEATDTG